MGAKSRSTTIVRVSPSFRILVDRISQERGCSKIKATEEMCRVFEEKERMKRERFKKMKNKGFNDVIGGNIF